MMLEVIMLKKSKMILMTEIWWGWTSKSSTNVERQDPNWTLGGMECQFETKNKVNRCGTRTEMNGSSSLLFGFLLCVKGVWKSTTKLMIDGSWSGVLFFFVVEAEFVFWPVLVKATPAKVVGYDHIRDGIEHKLDVLCVRGTCHVTIDFLCGRLVLSFELGLDVGSGLAIFLCTWKNKRERMLRKWLNTTSQFVHERPIDKTTGCSLHSFSGDVPNVLNSLSGRTTRTGNGLFKQNRVVVTRNWREKPPFLDWPQKIEDEAKWSLGRTDLEHGNLRALSMNGKVDVNVYYGHADNVMSWIYYGWCSGVVWRDGWILCCSHCSCFWHDFLFTHQRILGNRW